MKLKEELDKILLSVQKPGRYIGEELNISKKKDPLVRMALSYPDLYEIGMSNNGLKILYEIANNLKEVACERVFAVELDFEKLLREKKIPLYTLESYTFLNQLDLIGFNLSHELLATNVLQILDLGQIPLLRQERKFGDPIVIAGGEATSNPFPMSDFIDAFLIGDGEEALTEILAVFLKAKSEKLIREEVLSLLSEIEGIFLPMNCQTSYQGLKLKEINGAKVTKRLYLGEKISDPLKPIIPNIRISQERMVLELAKGCPNLCNFCQAGYYNLPYRSYHHQLFKDHLSELIKNTGYDSLTLSSLSISDYPQLFELLNEILPILTEKGISISLPSLRVDRKTTPLIEQISDLRKTSLTFAVESASEKIRLRSNKKVNTNDLLDFLGYFFKQGWKKIKLYFMVGLPGCEEEDEAEQIVNLLFKIVQKVGPKKEINVTVSPFVPKSHTPFEREKQMGEDYFRKIIQKIIRNVPRQIKIKSHDIKSSLLEGILARGNDLLGDVILAAYQKGARLDSWREHFNFSIWEDSFNQIIPAWKEFFGARGEDEILPWKIITIGYENLIEKNRQKEGLCKKKPLPKSFSDPKNISLLSQKEALASFQKKYLTKERSRIFLTKKGPARFIPHLDFIEIIKRSLRRTKIPVSFSQGFNKREKISLGFPIPLGIESESEICDLDLYKSITIEQFMEMNKFLPKGIQVEKVKLLQKKESLMGIIKMVEYKINSQKANFIEKIKENLDNKIAFYKEEGPKKIKLPFSEVVFSFDFFTSGTFFLKLFIGRKNSLRIDKVILSLAEIKIEEFYHFRVIKTGQFYESSNNFIKIGFDQA